MNFKVAVGTCTVASASHFSNLLTLLNLLSFTHKDTVVVGIERKAPVRMFDLNQISVSTRVPASGNNDSGAAATTGVPMGAAISIPLCIRPQRQPNPEVKRPLAGQI